MRIIAGLTRPEYGRVDCGDELWLDTGPGIDLAPGEGTGAARTLRVRQLADARPGTLSGGERQRESRSRAQRAAVPRASPGAPRPDCLAGPQPLAAETTETAARELGLAPGDEVTASWKAAATRLLDL